MLFLIENVHLVGSFDDLNGLLCRVAGKFGGMGHNGGMFHWVHVATMDSRGNIYTGEVTGGKRIQKFIPVR